MLLAVSRSKINRFFELKNLKGKVFFMSIDFDNPVGNSASRPITGPAAGNNETQIKGTVEPDSFLSLLKRISGSTDLSATGPARPEPAQKSQKALELCQRMKQQMNESLLRLMSESEEENGSENTFMEGLKTILSKQEKEMSFLSRNRQTPSEIDQPVIQMSDRRVEKKIQIDATKSDVSDIDRIIQNAASSYGVDINLIRRVIEAESNFKPDAVSSKGAMGLMQLMPETAKELGVKDPLDPAENVMAGTRYLKKLLDRYDGSVPHALAAYNWGMGNLDTRRSRMPAETRNYVAKITGAAFS